MAKQQGAVKVELSGSAISGSGGGQLAEEKGKAIVGIDFAADAGKGLEHADKDSFAVPFLSMLQGLSPQVSSGEVAGARAGLMINTVTNELFDKALVVPVAFQRKYLRWTPRDAGGGFKGEMPVAQVEELIAAGQAVQDEDGALIFEGDQLKDTRVHYVLLRQKSGNWTPAVMSLSSTQIKRSKRWLTQINTIQMPGAGGKTFTPPSFSHIYELGSEKETNDRGAWFSFTVKLVEPVADADLYEAAKKFHAQVTAGKVTIKHEENGDEKPRSGF